MIRTLIGAAAIAAVTSPVMAETDVTLIVPVTAGEFAERVALGARAAAEARGDALAVEVKGPASFDAAMQVQMFQNELLRGPDAILLLPIPPSMFVEPGLMAEDQGVPVVVVTVPPTEDGPGKLFVGDNSLDMGRLLAEELADLLIEKHGPDVSGSIVVGNCLPGLINLDDRITGATEVLAERLPNVSISDPIVSDVEPGGAFAAWSAAVQGNADALAMMDACEAGNIALKRLKESDGYDFEIVAWDLTEQIMDGVEQGLIHAVVPQPSFLHGYVGAEIVARALEDGTPMPEGWVETPLQVVTRENIAAFKAAEANPDAMLEFYGPGIERILAADDYGIQPMSGVRE